MTTRDDAYVAVTTILLAWKAPVPPSSVTMRVGKGRIAEQDAGQEPKKVWA